MTFTPTPTVLFGCRRSSTVRLLFMTGLASLALSVMAAEEHHAVVELPAEAEVEAEVLEPLEEVLPEPEPEQGTALSQTSKERLASKRKELIAAGMVAISIFISALLLYRSHKAQKATKAELAQREALMNMTQTLIKAHQTGLEDLKQQLDLSREILDMANNFADKLNELESLIGQKESRLQELVDNLNEGDLEAALKAAIELQGETQSQDKE